MPTVSGSTSSDRFAAPSALTDLDLKILWIENQTWKLRGAKEQYIRDELGLRWVQYYYRLAKLLEHPEAEKRDPMLVRRLRRLRDQTVQKKRRMRTE